ncbi:hypothetical protein BUALT_Bualt03G0088000 [Buddleja alternifolia]|uniref:PUM-HD domain-containing protein n=1 Tax=Buddleja alternifolia TaxID=168488 RepID=A0AAV6XZJ7_9LAMI|nr:hypothetical protein BUALT_Bualt03G0088000 [Buddleja alternifolia]
MERSNSQTITKEQNPDDYEEGIVLSFESFGLGEEDEINLRRRRHERPTANNKGSSSSGSAGASYSDFSLYTLLEEDAVDDINSKKNIKIQCLTSQETSVHTTKSISDDQCYNLWSGQSIWNAGEASSSNVHNNGAESSIGSMDYIADKYFDPISAQQSYGAGSSSGQSGINSFYNYSSTSNSENQFISSKPLLYNYDPSFRPMRIDTLDNYQFNEIENNGFYSGHEYDTADSPQIILNCLQKALEGGDYEQIDRVLNTLQSQIFSLMTDEKMHFVFRKFVDACEGERLNSVVGELFGWSEPFIIAACCRQGVTSITKLLKKLKKTDHAFTVTEIVSTRFLEMMTHYRARDVILQCLNLFGTGPNMILYEKAVIYFPELAIHQVGCRSLIECIDTITGVHRSILLNHIAYIADYLSNDPYGNYVVQHVLGLKNIDVTCKILQRLQGQFVELAKKKNGSHVVEKCIQSSEAGTIYVVQEILGSPKAAFQLAQHQFGNYVIKRALVNTKEQGFTPLHTSLIKALEPYWNALNGSLGGKSVINCLRNLTEASVERA